MSTSIQTQQNYKLQGQCPHGLPPSACPVCSGGGGGSRLRKFKNTSISKPRDDRWSYAKCFAEGMAIRSRMRIAKESKIAFEKEIENSENFRKNIQNLSEKIKNFIQNSNNFLLKTGGEVVFSLVINPILKTLSQMPVIFNPIKYIYQNINTITQSVMEKLSALLGDIKNFEDRKISKLFRALKKRAKKIIYMFFIFDTENENYSNDEVLAIFKSRELNKFFTRVADILRRAKHDDASQFVKGKTDKPKQK